MGSVTQLLQQAGRSAQPASVVTGDQSAIAAAAELNGVAQLQPEIFDGRDYTATWTTCRPIT